MAGKTKEERVPDIFRFTDTATHRIKINEPDFFSEEQRAIIYAMFDLGVCTLCTLSFFLDTEENEMRRLIYGDDKHEIVGLWGILEEETGLTIESMPQLPVLLVTHGFVSIEEKEGVLF
ncbi:MAG: hypothetical protein ABI758_02335 [Candidatus Woesebacteria bacterium]